MSKIELFVLMVVNSASIGWLVDRHFKAKKGFSSLSGAAFLLLLMIALMVENL